MRSDLMEIQNGCILGARGKWRIVERKAHHSVTNVGLYNPVSAWFLGLGVSLRERGSLASVETLGIAEGYWRRFRVVG